MTPQHRSLNRYRSHVAANVPDDVTCSRGCHACCYQPVSVNRYEAQRIINALVRQPGGFGYIKRAVAQEQAEHQRWVNSATELGARGRMYWQGSNLACPMLSEMRECAVYGERPLACRGFYSIGDPQDCYDWHACSVGVYPPNLGYVPSMYGAGKSMLLMSRAIATVARERGLV